MNSLRVDRRVLSAMALLASGCGHVVVPAPETASVTPPCTAVVAVGNFEVVKTAVGLSVESTGKLGNSIGPSVGGGIRQAVRAARLRRDRKRGRMERRFEQRLRKALSDNAHALGVGTDSATLTVHGTLDYAERLEIEVHGEEEPEKRTHSIVNVHFVVVDAAGDVVAEQTRPPISSLRGERDALDRAAQALLPALVGRPGTAAVPFASTFSRDVRLGRRAARKQNWAAAEAHWRRASVSADHAVQRAGHFNLGLLYERQGDLKRALKHYEAAAAVFGAHLGHAYLGPPPSSPIIAPDDGYAHVNRLHQRLRVETCTPPPTPASTTPSGRGGPRALHSGP